MPRTKELSHSALSRTLTNALVAVSSTAAWPIPECPFTCTNVTALCCLTCTSKFFPKRISATFVCGVALSEVRCIHVANNTAVYTETDYYTRYVIQRQMAVDRLLSLPYCKISLKFLFSSDLATNFRICLY